MWRFKTLHDYTVSSITNSLTKHTKYTAEDPTEFESKALRFAGFSSLSESGTQSIQNPTTTYDIVTLYTYNIITSMLRKTIMVTTRV